MPDQVLIVAGDAAARASAEAARSLQFTPVVATSEEDAVRLLDQQPFCVIALTNDPAGVRLRQHAEAQPARARVLELPDGNGDDTAVRRAMLRHLGARAQGSHFSAEERYRFLGAILE